MSADALLERLHGVKTTGPGRWIGRCPSHQDKTPSLSIRELDDGRLLLHDFGGCAVEDVLSAVGLKFDDLYPERAVDRHVRRDRRPFDAWSTLRSLSTERGIAVIFVADMRAGRSPSHQDHARFLLACNRIGQAMEFCDAK